MNMRNIVPCLAFLSLLPVTAVQGEELSGADAILQELKLLRSSVDRLEQRVADLEMEVANLSAAGVESPEAPAPGASETATVQADATLIDKVAGAIAGREEAINYPWMDAAKWEQISEGMSLDAVVGILGEPTLTEPSLHKRIDLVLTWRGRRAATGERVMGKVKFRHDEAVEIEKPKL